ncbi:MAG TPA: 50S ribosomal protein L21 [Patescibacteria group bacterium]|nr:50S ribosomal protein L21 [Patescibacteria group bacterium]
MKYVVVKINGKQHLLSEGTSILVDKVVGKLDPKILLYVDGEKFKLGNPEVAGVKIDLKVIEEIVKGDKIMVSKYKAKSRYRRKIGFRPQYTRLKLEKIA